MNTAVKFSVQVVFDKVGRDQKEERWTLASLQISLNENKQQTDKP